MKKKVWVLYRVSTKSQVNTDDDIPMQRIACEEFIKTHPDWVIDKELYERGVSGWKKKTEDRDELIQIKEGALNKEYDVLLVFMFDRLGRRTDESPMVVEFLVKNGVEVWSVKEGQAKLEQHSDSLINYIRFWQSAGESKKTSMRVKEAMKQLNENGYFSGGTVPYGYKIVETDIKHPKKDKFLNKLMPDDYEATLIKLIFDLALNKGYGASRIAQYMNENKYDKRGSVWRHNSISRILRNPIYMGRKRYNVTNEEMRLNNREEWKLQPYDKDLDIVTKEVFLKTQKLIDNRRMNNENVNTPTKSQSLLSGIVHCGYCRKKLKNDYTVKKYRRKTDGIVTTSIQPRYRCHNSRNFKNHGMANFGAKSYDKAVERAVLNVIHDLKLDKFTDELNSYKKENIKLLTNELKKLNSNLDKKNIQLEKLNDEIALSLLGESKFSPERLESVISKTELDIEEIKSEIKKVENELTDSEIEVSDINELKSDFENWEEKYKNGSLDDKKIMLSRIIKEVYLLDKKVSITFKFDFDKINLKNADFMENKVDSFAEILNNDTDGKSIELKITQTVE